MLHPKNTENTCFQQRGNNIAFKFQQSVPDTPFPCKGDSLTLDISSWERGTYMLHIHTRGAVVIRKLAVQ